MTMSKKTLKRYTKEEDEIILNYIKTSNSVTEACLKASTQLNRTPLSISQHYYASKTFKSIKNDKIKAKEKKYKNIKRMLVKEIKKNPNNITQAFKNVSEKTGMNFNTLSCAYYSKTSYLSKNNMNVCFALVSDKKTIYNGKNTENNQPKVSQSKTNRLLDFVKNLFK